MAVTLEEQISIGILKEEIDGQYSFIDVSKISTSDQEEDDFENLDVSFWHFIQYTNAEIKRLNGYLKNFRELKEKTTVRNTEEINTLFKKLQKDFEDFIDVYFAKLDEFTPDEDSYAKILDKYEKDPSSYHRLGKLFVEYLFTFVYKDSGIDSLKDAKVIRVENFIEADPWKYSSAHGKAVLETIQNRQKLRVENYIVFHGEPLLEKLTVLADTKELGFELHSEIKKIQDNKVLQKVIFESGNESFISSHQEEILAVLFLHYLEKCVYYDSFQYPNVKVQEFVAKIENYVICHFSNDFKLSKRQEKVYQDAKNRVALRLKEYVNQKYEDLSFVLRDFDSLEDFKKSGKLRMIEEHDDISSLPKVYSQEEVKQKLETFIQVVFMVSKNYKKENLPIYDEELKEQKHKAMMIALEYLDRFVYSVSTDYLITDRQIARLEGYIDGSSDFKLNDQNSRLCVAKSTLYARVGRRNTLYEENDENFKRKKVAIEGKLG